MSHLSFARIMYGTAQENHAPAFLPVSNLPSNLPRSSGASMGLPTTGATIESLLHKAWLALTK
jgi:hypothetical protein